MPWHIEQQGDQHCVIKDADGHNEGCHMTQAEAEDHMAALYANEPPMPDMALASQDGEQWFEATFLEGEPSRDSGGLTRVVEPGATRLDRKPPLPMYLLTQNGDSGHSGAVFAGDIRVVTRDANSVTVWGVFDTGPDGREAARLVGEGRITSWSPGMGQDTTTEEVTATELVDLGDGSTMEVPSAVTLRVTDAVLLEGTITPMPALDSARIRLVDGPPVGESVAADAAPCEDCDEQTPGQIMRTLVYDGKAWGDAVTIGGTATAAAVDRLVAAIDPPTLPPAEWFDDPQLPGPTPLTITDDGRVFGHAAVWGQCHTSHLDRCVMAPRSQSNYAYFQTGSIRTTDGTRRVGQLTMGCGHANLSADARAAAAHYDGGPGAVQWADVAAGEDAHGIWVAGAIRPGLSDVQLREAAAQALSGDWRSIGGALEMVAALSVPVPGFPVVSLAASAAQMPQRQARITGDEVLALVAAGRLLPTPPWQQALTAMAARVAELEATVARLHAITKPMVGMAGDLLAERFNGNTATTVA